MKIDWKHLFNWEISKVYRPVKAVQSGVHGYMVAVEYKFHGKEELFFSVEDDRMYTTYVNPETAAHECYEAYVKHQERQIGRNVARVR